MPIGVVPVALALSEGGEVRSAMGVAVIGGMLTSTFLTLFVVPTAYITFDGTMNNIVALLQRMGFKFATENPAGIPSQPSGLNLKKAEDLRSGKVIDSEEKERR